ncbi:latent transforming growth factor beta-binding protein [Pyxidicoccus xibeiensis]|uniref:latent transforming growth factor beta-binding protein n=1 Tax=Pyxidicoccus xibeiensis TaxID=2906759 RepID=UPI0020A8242E|nr:latent transforming growth factor beta-binding protein [Pyxidicoccus xibeiensis]MCP3137753.1 latent transforming growth factor beta-binding protein [Pyxidicoccus xibeiensis]
MRNPVLSLLACLALLTLLGCPLDIEVREEDLVCEDEPCGTSCVADAECPDDQRCDGLEDVCVPGPRLTETCSGFGSCQPYASCEESRCEMSCSYGCPPGYRCGPENLCVEECTSGVPETLGDYCETSMDCTRCGFCVADAGGAKRCHQPCSSDGDCPGGTPGSCELIPRSSLRVCRLGQGAP